MGSVEESLRERALRVLSPSIYGGDYAYLANPASLDTPGFFSRAKGTRLWDADGREYIDYQSAFGPNLLGYGDPRVEAAAAEQRALGDTMNGPAPVLVELAETFVKMVSHADWVLFSKNGGDAVSTALLIARAYTGKRRVLVESDAYHGSSPWCTPVQVGILPEHRLHRATFTHNNLESLTTAVEKAGNDLAAILVTAYKHDGLAPHELPTVEFAKHCRALCDATGALLIVDDVRAGLRLARDCSWSLMGVKPDLSCWSKAISNGYPISAVLGSQRVKEAASPSLICGTFWLQAVPMAAALATLKIVGSTRYLEHVVELGQMLRAGLDEKAKTYGFSLNQSGPVQMPQILFDDDPDFRFVNAFTDAMRRRGVFFPSFHNSFICAAMTSDDVGQTIEAAESTFAELAGRRTSIEPNPRMVQKLNNFFNGGTG